MAAPPNGTAPLGKAQLIELFAGMNPNTPGIPSIVEECGQAIKSAAQRAQVSDDAEAVWKFGQGAYFFAQAIEKMVPEPVQQPAEGRVDGVKAAESP